MSDEAKAAEYAHQMFHFGLITGLVVGLIVGVVMTAAVAMLVSRLRPAKSSQSRASALATALPLTPAATNAAPPVSSAPRKLAPLASALIDLRDGLLGDDQDPLRVRLYARLGDLLAREGVETIETASGPLDVALHDAAGTKTTTDAALSETIASSVRPGYRYDGAIVRPQQVIVYVVRPG